MQYNIIPPVVLKARHLSYFAGFSWLEMPYIAAPRFGIGNKADIIIPEIFAV